RTSLSSDDSWPFEEAAKGMLTASSCLPILHRKRRDHDPQGLAKYARIAHRFVAHGGHLNSPSLAAFEVENNVNPHWRLPGNFAAPTDRRRFGVIPFYQNAKLNQSVLSSVVSTSKSPQR